MRKLELQQKGLHDNYNTMEKPLDITQSEKIVNANLEYAPRKGQTWLSYITELSIHIGYSEQKNTRSHINTPKGPWYTHRSPMGCFMCEDMALIHFMLRMLKELLTLTDVVDRKF